MAGGWTVRVRANPLSLGVWHFTLRFVLPRSWVGYPSRRPKGCGMQSPSGPKVYPVGNGDGPDTSSEIVGSNAHACTYAPGAWLCSSVASIKQRTTQSAHAKQRTVATQSRCRAAATAVRSQEQVFSFLDSERGSTFTLCSRCTTNRTRLHCTVDGRG